MALHEQQAAAAAAYMAALQAQAQQAAAAQDQYTAAMAAAAAEHAYLVCPPPAQQAPLHIMVGKVRFLAGLAWAAALAALEERGCGGVMHAVGWPQGRLVAAAPTSRGALHCSGDRSASSIAPLFPNSSC